MSNSKPIPAFAENVSAHHANCGVIRQDFCCDFLIDTYSLLDSIIGSLPRRGDAIVEIDGNHTFIFEVMALGGEPPWRYSDPFRLKLRIHTKQVASHETRVLSQTVAVLFFLKPQA